MTKILKLDEQQQKYLLAFLHQTTTNNVADASKLLSLYQKVESMEDADFEAIEKGYKDQIKKLERMNTALKNDFDRLLKERDSNVLNKKIKKLEKDLESSETRLREEGDDLEAIEKGYKDQVKKLEKEIELLESRLSEEP